MSRGRDNKGFGLKSREGHRGEKMANLETAQGYVQSRMAVPCLLRMSFVPETLNEGRLQRWGKLGVEGVSAGLPALGYTPTLLAHVFPLHLSIQPEKPFVFSWQN